MRSCLLLSLLLLGRLQAVLTPAPAPAVRDGLPHISAGPGGPTPNPAEPAGAFRRPSEAPPLNALSGDGKLQKVALAAGLSPVRDSGTASARIDIAGPVAAESILLTPRKPRAPPPAPSC